MPETRTAFLLGATGLVGSRCLQALLAEPRYRRVIAITRRPIAINNGKLEQHQIDFDRLEKSSGIIRADDIYCAIGTTIRHSGSKESFRQVDFAYPLKTAQLACANGAKRMIVITSIGANPESRFFYLQVKGELESALSKLPFEAIHFLRPAWLVGQREQKRLREDFGIAVAKVLSSSFIGKWKNYRSTEAHVVARAMVAAGLSDTTGIHIYKTTDIWKLAGSESGR